MSRFGVSNTALVLSLALSPKTESTNKDKRAD